jgi:uncharacterized protein (TIGR03067 family)
MDKDVAALHGDWDVTSLEVEGATMASGLFSGSGIIIDGDNFTTVAMGEGYGGTFTVDSSVSPKTLDLKFLEGPHSGMTSLGIYELVGNDWKLCIAFAGLDRPKDFVTESGSGHALETLRRRVNGEESPEHAASQSSNIPSSDAMKSERRADVAQLTADSEEMAKLQGNWTMVSCVRSGQALPPNFLATGKREARDSVTTVTLGGQLILKAQFTVDPGTVPNKIDYVIVEGPNTGQIQHGIYEFEGEHLRTCFSVPGADRPVDFVSTSGDDRTVTVWKQDS